MKVLGIAAITIVSFVFLFPTVSDYFMFDDITHVRESDLITSCKNIPSFFSKSLTENKVRLDPLYRPVLLSSLCLEHAMFGKNPFWFHLANLVLHTIASILLFVLISDFWGYGFRSLIPSLIFSVLPVHVDTIAFVINRSDILVVIFLIAALLVLLKSGFWKAYLDLSSYRVPGNGDENHIKKVIAASVLFILALFSKESAACAIVVLFAFILLRSFLTRSLPPRKALIGFAFLFLAVMVYLSVKYAAVGGISSPQEIPGFKGKGFFVIFPTMSRIFMEYIFLSAAPFSLRVNYSEYAISQSLFEGRALLSYIFHIFIFFIAALNLKKRPIFSFFIFAFYLSLLPVSHVLPFYEIKAERFLYLPSIFYCLALCYPLGSVKSESRISRTILFGYVAVIIFYGSISLSYSTFFRSPKTLWAEMIERCPKNAIFHSNMGLYLFFHEKDYPGALPYLEKAVRLHPKLKNNYSPLGVIYDSMKKSDMAEKAFLTGLKLDPEDSQLNLNYAVFKCLRGRYKEAYPYLKRAVMIDPKNSMALLYLDEVERRLKVKER